MHDDKMPPREAGLAMNITTSMAIHRYQMLKDAGVARAEEAQYLKRCPVGGGLMLSGVPLTPVEKLHPRVQKWLREVWNEHEHGKDNTSESANNPQ